MKTMRQISIFIATFAVSVGLAAEMKMGYVDIQKAIQTTTAGKKAKKVLEKEFNKRKKELEKREADLKKMGTDLEKKKAVLTPEVLGRKQAEMQQEMMKYRELVAKNQMEIQQKETQLTAPIIKKLRGAIDKVAEKGKFTFILEKREQSIIWAKADYDLTSEVVKAFEKMKDTKKKKK